MKSCMPDYPAGVIEGFYGKPWTNAERFTLFDWLQTCGLNTYIYAPKDDLKHRAAWREPYSASESKTISSLILGCKRRRISFCYAIAPGLDMRFSADSDHDALRNKLAQIIKMGCRSFALLFDDIPARLAPHDRKIFGSQASAQAAAANSLCEWLGRHATGSALFLCPTVYCGAMARPSVSRSEYLRELGDKLHPAIKVFWTGPDIISGEIPVDSIREFRSVLKRRPVLWDNLYANDYDMRRLHTGPYTGRPPALKAETDGTLLNPNCQFHANFVPVRSFASWLRAPARSNLQSAWNRAIRTWLAQFKIRPPHKITFKALRLFCDFLYLPTAPGPGAAHYLHDLQMLLRTPPRRWAGLHERFQRTSRLVLSLFDSLLHIENRDLLHAIYAHAWELKERVLLLKAWADWRKANPATAERFAPAEFSPALLRGSTCAELDRIIEQILAGSQYNDCPAAAHPRIV
ncbi:MAG: beta-N-acetylglucosaminidase domain-containing protein [Verrucomicrobiota bacterium]|nr:beta-N-acetylglucosaminidase domain-containing protein [Verrucomicrobiota bacterium]